MRTYKGKWIGLWPKKKKKSLESTPSGIQKSLEESYIVICIVPGRFIMRLSYIIGKWLTKTQNAIAYVLFLIGSKYPNNICF